MRQGPPLLRASVDTCRAAGTVRRGAGCLPEAQAAAASPRAGRAAVPQSRLPRRRRQHDPSPASRRLRPPPSSYRLLYSHLLPPSAGPHLPHSPLLPPPGKLQRQASSHGGPGRSGAEAHGGAEGCTVDGRGNATPRGARQRPACQFSRTLHPITGAAGPISMVCPPAGPRVLRRQHQGSHRQLQAVLRGQVDHAVLTPL